MARHRPDRDGPSRRRVVLPVSAALAVVVVGAGVAIAAVSHSSSTDAATRSTVATGTAPTGSVAPTATTSPPAAPTSSAAPTPSTPTSSAPRAATSPTTGSATATRAVTSTQLADLVAERSRSSTSVAAVDLTRHTSITQGATSGMTAASVAKVELLESLLLKHQRAGTALSDDEVDTVTAMIEHSDNDAANDTFYDIGGRDAVQDLQPALGLSPKTTALGPSDLWGLSTTSAAQQLILLHDLVDSHSPLDASHRAFALSLMRHVESDQDWGVPVAASKDTAPAVKNGWLAVSSDGNLWAVNSVGVITVHGDTVLVAVMTQHGASFDGGIDRVETLVRAAVSAVT